MNPARSSRFDQRRRDLANAPVRPGGSPPGAGHPQGPMMTSELAALLAALLAHRLRASLCTTLDRILRAYRLDRWAGLPPEVRPGPVLQRPGQRRPTSARHGGWLHPMTARPPSPPGPTYASW